MSKSVRRMQTLPVNPVRNGLVASTYGTGVELYKINGCSNDVATRLVEVGPPGGVTSSYILTEKKSVAGFGIMYRKPTSKTPVGLGFNTGGEIVLMILKPPIAGGGGVVFSSPAGPRSVK